MPTGPSSIEYDPLGIAYQWLVDELVRHDDWGRVINVFISRAPATPDDDDPPSVAQCPWVRLTPHRKTGEPRVYAQVGPRTVWEVPLLIDVESAVLGGETADSMAVCSLMNRILWPEDRADSFIKRHQDAYVITYRFLSLPIGGSQQDGDGYIYAMGQLCLYVSV